MRILLPGASKEAANATPVFNYADHLFFLGAIVLLYA